MVLNKKKVYLVFGGESCGNHLATNLLVSAGVKKGTTTQDIILPEKVKPEDLPIVYRRSFPHGPIWYDSGIIQPMLKKGLIETKDVGVIVPIRNWHCAIKSAIMRNHSKTRKEAVDKLIRAYKSIFNDISKNDWDYLQFFYDEAVRCAYNYVPQFYSELGFELNQDKLNKIISTITNENDKFYSNDYKPSRKTDGY